MNYGVQKCIWTALGDITANFIQATLVIFVIGSFFSENSTLLNTFKWIGVAYILYLAYDLYNSRPKDISSNNISSNISKCCPNTFLNTIIHRIRDDHNSRCSRGNK